MTVHIKLATGYVTALTAVILNVSPCAAQLDEELLKQYDNSVTSYLASATGEQDAQPQHLQRGAYMDGTVRAGAFFGWMTNAQPFGESFNANATLNGLSLVTGAYNAAAVDLTLPAKQPWVIGRSYNAAQSDGSLHRNSNSYQGVNWFQSSQPELVFYDDATSSDDDLMYLVYGADRFIAFRRLLTAEEPDTFSTTQWRAINGAGGVLESEAGTGGEPDT